MNDIGKSADKISAWLGGILDGEGSIYIEKTLRKNGNIKLQPQIKIGNMDTTIISEVVSEINKVTGCYVQEKNIKNGKMYYVVVKGFKRCNELLPHLLEILRGVKKLKAKYMLLWLSYRSTKSPNDPVTNDDLEFYEIVNGNYLRDYMLISSNNEDEDIVRTL